MIVTSIGPHTKAMPLLRSVIAVVVGYLVFAASAVALFQVSGHDPHSSDSIGFMVLGIFWGFFFATLAGFVAARIGGRYEIEHSLAVASLIAAAGAASLLMRDSLGVIWTQLAALLVMAPSAMAGGYLRIWQVRRSKLS
jgi:hypothetical protein